MLRVLSKGLCERLDSLQSESHKSNVSLGGRENKIHPEHTVCWARKLPIHLSNLKTHLVNESKNNQLLRLYLIRFTPTFMQSYTHADVHPHSHHKCAYYDDDHKAKQTVCHILGSSELGLYTVAVLSDSDNALVSHTASQWRHWVKYNVIIL